MFFMKRLLPEDFCLLLRVLKELKQPSLGECPIFFANNFVQLGKFVSERVENAFFSSLPQLVANGVMSLAHNTQKYLDVFADELLYLATNKTLASASKIRKLRSSSIEHYIAAAIIGFLIILILIIATMLR